MMQESKLSVVIESVFDKCIAPKASGAGCDNMTMIDLQFIYQYVHYYIKRDIFVQRFGSCLLQMHQILFLWQVVSGSLDMYIVN